MRLSPHEIAVIKTAILQLDSKAQILAITWESCQSIGLKKEYPFNELLYLEALTSRFARLSDLLVRKLFRLIHQLDYEPQETVRDSINRAEKLGIITSAVVFSEIRETRNAIAHEYLLEDLAQLYKSVFANTPQLLDTVVRVQEYCKKYY